MSFVLFVVNLFATLGVTQVNLELEVLRFQIRLAKVLKALPVKSHGFAASTMLSIGSQIGGWLKNRS